MKRHSKAMLDLCVCVCVCGEGGGLCCLALATLVSLRPRVLVVKAMSTWLVLVASFSFVCTFRGLLASLSLLGRGRARAMASGRKMRALRMALSSLRVRVSFGPSRRLTHAASVCALRCAHAGLCLCAHPSPLPSIAHLSSLFNVAMTVTRKSVPVKKTKGVR